MVGIWLVVAFVLPYLLSPEQVLILEGSFTKGILFAYSIWSLGAVVCIAIGHWRETCKKLQNGQKVSGGDLISSLWHSSLIIPIRSWYRSKLPRFAKIVNAGDICLIRPLFIIIAALIITIPLYLLWGISTLFSTRKPRRSTSQSSPNTSAQPTAKETTIMLMGAADSLHDEIMSALSNALNQHPTGGWQSKAPVTSTTLNVFKIRKHIFTFTRNKARNSAKHHLSIFSLSSKETFKSSIEQFSSHRFYNNLRGCIFVLENPDTADNRAMFARAFDSWYHVARVASGASIRNIKCAIIIAAASANARDFALSALDSDENCRKFLQRCKMADALEKADFFSSCIFIPWAPQAPAHANHAGIDSCTRWLLQEVMK